MYLYLSTEQGKLTLLKVAQADAASILVFQVIIEPNYTRTCHAHHATHMRSTSRSANYYLLPCDNARDAACCFVDCYMFVLYLGSGSGGDVCSSHPSPAADWCIICVHVITRSRRSIPIVGHHCWHHQQTHTGNRQDTWSDTLHYITNQMCETALKRTHRITAYLHYIIWFTMTSMYSSVCLPRPLPPSIRSHPCWLLHLLLCRFILLHALFMPSPVLCIRCVQCEHTHSYLVRSKQESNHNTKTQHSHAHVPHVHVDCDVESMLKPKVVYLHCYVSFVGAKYTHKGEMTRAHETACVAAGNNVMSTLTTTTSTTATATATAALPTTSAPSSSSYARSGGSSSSRCRRCRSLCHFLGRCIAFWG